MDAVFFDTNRIRNTGTQSFFGHANEIRRIASAAQVYMPSIVMDEIKQQKIRKLEGNLAQFKSNYFTSFLEIETTNLGQHIIAKLDDLYTGASAEFDYIEYALKDDPKHLDTLKTLALKKHPPFSKDDGNDKGFKDSIIYLMIQQYLEDNEKISVFLFTQDGRLKDAFEKNDRVVILWEFKEYFDYNAEYFKSEYFLETLNQFLADEGLVQQIREKAAAGTLIPSLDGWEEDKIVPFNLGEPDINNIDLTENNDWAITISPEGVQVEVLVDFASKEIISGEML